MRQLVNDLADWMIEMMKPEPESRKIERARFKNAVRYWAASGAITYTRGKK